MSDQETFVTSIPATLNGWWRDTRVALAFLTRLPIPVAPEDVAAKDALAKASRAFPIVGLVVGLVAGGVILLGFWLRLGPLASALFALAAAAAITGALHEDGLADVADGFGGGVTPTDKMAIMRDSRIGTFGVLAVVFSVGLRAAVLFGLFHTIGPVAGALVAAAVFSRGVLPMVMYRLDLARDDGLAYDAGRPTRTDALVALVLGGLLAFLFLDFFAGIAAVLVGGAAAAAFAWYARRQIGGYTGDVLGATQQVTELAVIVAVALATT